MGNMLSFSLLPRWVVCVVLCSLASVAQAAEATPSPAPAPPKEIDIERIENNVVYLSVPSGISAPSSIKTDLSDIKHLGTLRADDGGFPYFLVSAKPCTDCAQESAIYLLRPGQGRVTSFVFPGRLLDSKTRAMLLESRAFFGRCLPGMGDAYVVFQKERVDRRKSLQASVYVASVAKDRIDERLIERGLPSINHALNNVKHKKCKEVEGRYRVVNRKPLELRYLSREKDAEEDAAEGADEASDGAKAAP